MYVENYKYNFEENMSILCIFYHESGYCHDFQMRRRRLRSSVYGQPSSKNAQADAFS